ncbi:antibiotic biosynthesis monooxygenase family protein [Lysobacter silvisoli]|uniref:antibiotic biosynthesis monooxygenase family protein n=1 Tax=Lysobacter silvisoli TaxID=2293254 RepID=UPI001314C28D|nr:antibiotic biosynthesis monooxygenase family protein [Lysobacter silvisoli]
MAIWQYEVRAGAEAEFETLYGADGAWVTLFREHAGYLGTDLLRDADSGRYLSIDRWRSEADYRSFLAADPTRYANLDAQGDALTLSERRIGHYSPTAAP